MQINIKLAHFLFILFFLFALSALTLTFAISQTPKAHAFFVLGDSDKAEDVHEEENEVENEVEEENETENEHEESSDNEDNEHESNETEETISSSNGTTSTIQRKIEDNGKEKLKIKTYNSNGTLLEEKEYEGDGEEAELKIKQFDQYGNKLLELKYKNEDGEEIKLKIQGTTTGESKIRYDFEKQKLFLNVKDLNEDEQESENENFEENEEEDELEIEVENNTFKIRHRNSLAYVNFPITIDEETGQIFVTTGNGEVELKQLPDVVIEKALASQEVDDVNETSIEEDVENGLEYNLDGEKKEKLFGLIEVAISKTLIYDTETGELVDIDLTPLNQILDLLSF